MERKAVLNVTVGESLADEVRRVAHLRDTTISSVVERALAEQLRRERIQQAAIASVEADYAEYGRPTDEELATARAQVAEQERIADEAIAAMKAEGYRFPPPWMYDWSENDGAA